MSLKRKGKRHRIPKNVPKFTEAEHSVAEIPVKNVYCERSINSVRPFNPYSAMLRHPSKPIVPGEPLNLLNETFIEEAQLRNIFRILDCDKEFRWFAGRTVVDFKISGSPSFELEPPYDFLNPLIIAMTAMAWQTMRENEELAVIQILVNYFKNERNKIKRHRHRCRQLCVSLGADRDLFIKRHVNKSGRHVGMNTPDLHMKEKQVPLRFGDVLHLDGEVHCVPPAEGKTGVRISICMFYGSKEEYMKRSLLVHGDPSVCWFVHPQDLKSMGLPAWQHIVRSRLEQEGRSEGGGLRNEMEEKRRGKRSREAEELRSKSLLMHLLASAIAATAVVALAIWLMLHVLPLSTL